MKVLTDGGSRRLRVEGTLDSLNGLLNRAATLEALEKEIARKDPRRSFERRRSAASHEAERSQSRRRRNRLERVADSAVST
jgi:hypothetical protein